MNKLMMFNEETIIELAKLAYGKPEWITSPIRAVYCPYDERHLDDAREFWLVEFEGYFAGDKTATYRFELQEKLDVVLTYVYESKIHYKIEKGGLGISNQRKIHNIITKIVGNE